MADSTCTQLNYLTKYLELLDTCFLFLKKKPLSMQNLIYPAHNIANALYF